MKALAKLLATSAVLASVVSLAPTALAQQDPSKWKQGDNWELVFGSATATGSYFAGMSAVATMLSGKVPNLRATATISPATTTEVYPQMVRGERIGGVASQDLTDAYRGEGAWKNRKIPVAGWAAVQEGFFNVFVLEKHGITKISQLKGSGLKIAAACAPPAKNNRARWDQPFTFFQILMDAHGLDAFTDVQVVPYCTSQALEQLGAGNIDGMSHTRALGDGATMEMMTKQKVVLLQPDSEAIIKVQKAYPAYAKKVPASVYPALVIPEPGDGFFHGVFFFLHSDLPDSLVYDMTKALWENIDVLRRSHPAYKGISIETALQGMPIPPHPGALKYYLEKNVPGAQAFATGK